MYFPHRFKSFACASQDTYYLQIFDIFVLESIYFVIIYSFLFVLLLLSFYFHLNP